MKRLFHPMHASKKNSIYFNFTIKILFMVKAKVQNFRVTKPRYEIEIRKITLPFELLTRKFL